MGIGTAVSYTSEYEANFNENVYSGMGYDAARVRAGKDAFNAALVEVLPGSAVGGLGVMQSLKLLAKLGGKAGAIAGRVAGWTASGGVGRTFLMEAGVGTFEEAVFEPVAEALLDQGESAALSALGVDYGLPRTWGESFSELNAIWGGDKSQLAAVVLFSAIIAGGTLPGSIKAQHDLVEWAKANLASETNVLALGLTGKQAKEVVQAQEGERMGLAQKYIRQNMEEDPKAMKKRIAKFGIKLQGEGYHLSLSGHGENQSQEARDVMAMAWEEEVKRGNAPKVEKMADRDGKEWFRITETNEEGETIVQEMPAEKADAYIMLKLAERNSEIVKENQRLVYKEGGIYTSIADTVNAVTGTALATALSENGEKVGMQTQDLNKLGNGIGEAVKGKGVMTPAEIERAAKELGGFFKGLDKTWNKRQEIGGRLGVTQIAGTRAFRVSTGKGRSVVLYSRGNATGLDIMEEISESLLGNYMAARTDEIMSGGQAVEREEAERQALAEFAQMVRDFRAEAVKLEPWLKNVIPEVGENAEIMDVVEAFSSVGRAKLMQSSAVPEWMHEVQDLVNLALAETAQAVKIADAAGRVEKATGKNPLVGIFKRMEVDLSGVITKARVDENTLSAVREARAAVEAYMSGDGVGTGAMSADSAIEEAEEAAEGESSSEAEESSEKEEGAAPGMEKAPEGTIPAEEAEKEEKTKENLPEAKAPEGMKGVFVNDQAVHNDAGDFWMGSVPVASLKLSDEVKPAKEGGAQRKGSEVNPLTAATQQDTEAVYVWRRKDGSLEVISGRDKFELAQRTGASSVTCYVYEEDAQHDATWARHLDSENAMRSGQADELTAATYVRETGLSDEELSQKGLVRKNPKIERGVLIARYAGEELWNRFKDGEIVPEVAETLCRMTRGIHDASKIGIIQSECCKKMKEGRGWYYINGVAQFLASMPSGAAIQDFITHEGDAAKRISRAGEWIEKGAMQIREGVDLAKRAADGSLNEAGRKRAEEMGLRVSTAAETAEDIRALTLLGAKLDNAGSYPELMDVCRAWDGRAKVDVVGMALEQARADVRALDAEKKMNREEWDMEQMRKAAENHDSTDSLFGGGSFSVAEAKERGLFDEHGIMHAANGVLIDGTSFSLTAMHASPHWIQDKFRMDKIGSGEGNQSYGSGMYFVTTDEANEHYLNQFKAVVRRHWLVNGEEVAADNLDKVIPGLPQVVKAHAEALVEAIQDSRPPAQIQEALRNHILNHEKVHKDKFIRAIRQTERRLKKGPPKLAQEPGQWRRDEETNLKNWREELNSVGKHTQEKLDAVRELVKWLEAGNTLVQIDREAYNYLVEIDAEENELLHWDDKMSDKSNEGAMELMLKSPVEEVRELAEGITIATGGEFYKKLTERMREKHGLGNSRSEKALAAKYASEALLASGIKGSKYADGLTRNKPKNQRTYNYVIWDENVLKITHTARGNRDWKPVPEAEEGGVRGSSMSVMTYGQWARQALRRRPDELEAGKVLKRFDKWLKMFDTAVGSTNKTLGTGAARLGVIAGLMEATRSVLPPQYQLGRLNVLMSWAAVYAELAETGEVPKSGGVLKGPIFDKFIDALEARRDMGMTEQELRDTLASLGAVKLEDALKKVARGCREQLDLFIKDRAREQIENLWKRAFPDKNEKGARKKGKMHAHNYRLAAEMLEAMNMTAAEVNSKLQAKQTELAAPNTTQERADELRTEMGILQTFGAWESLDAEAAEKALEAFRGFIGSGRTEWDMKEEERKA
ncbi:MAG: hypothetical protein LUE08_06145, partial [Akkermansiaceae bacterium]|nr:hypothetical protein [Akkermansiaceae bacterium]